MYSGVVFLPMHRGFPYSNSPLAFVLAEEVTIDYDFGI